MKPPELIAALKAKNPKILDDIPEKKAEQLLRAALTLIRDSVLAAPPGDMPIGMLGRFKIHEVAKGEGAEATTVRRVVFVPAKLVDKAAEGGAPGGKGGGKGPAKDKEQDADDD
jgi:hypothetical protein